MYKILCNFLLLFAQILTQFIETYRSTVHARNLSWWFDVHVQMCRCTECLWVSASLGLLYESQDNALVLNSGPLWYEDLLPLPSHSFLSKATTSQSVNLCAAPYVGAPTVCILWFTEDMPDCITLDLALSSKYLQLMKCSELGNLLPFCLAAVLLFIVGWSLD